MNAGDLFRVGLVTRARGLRGELDVMPLTDDPQRFRRLREVYIERPAQALSEIGGSGGSSSSSNQKTASTEGPCGDRAGVCDMAVESAAIESTAIESAAIESAAIESAAIESAAIESAAIESVRFHRGRVIVRFEGCIDVESAGRYRGCYISITRGQLIPLKKDSYYIFDLIGCAVYDLDGAPLGELTDVLETGSNDVYVVSPPNASDKLLIPALKTVVLDVDIVQKRIVVDYEQTQ